MVAAPTVVTWGALIATFFLLVSARTEEVSIADLDDSITDAETIANRTYVDEQTELQRRIFRNYIRRMRPVKNQSLPIEIMVHIYVMHLSVNQQEQTITINGHIYMTWRDEMAVWDPAEFNGVRMTMAKQWEVWTPDIRIANSVAGVNHPEGYMKSTRFNLLRLPPNFDSLGPVPPVELS
ncbi:hypothetical protein QR680_014740 [Steinernema hermaphroditum]|uniref:Neurotransmitter-gated ion-channel ligand-binding domain-containing protein n=1 Tax=Steinernema hermaphroditum TaxID=289476 RepID=A0AA39M4F5_9BILA|nr:hypothetical protein QR680_014740 [Steinernema hermaphroditum]